MDLIKMYPRKIQVFCGQCGNMSDLPIHETKSRYTLRYVHMNLVSFVTYPEIQCWGAEL